jgi:hypothetical protein
MNRRDASQFSNSGPILVVGRLSAPPKGIADHVLEGSTHLRITDTLQAQRLVQRPADWVRTFSERPEKALAFVGIGFGPAPNSNFEKYLWKGEFVEAEHPRVGPGSPEGGRFCSADQATTANSETGTIDNVNNQNVIIKDLMSRVEKRAARRLLRNRLVAGLRVLVGLAADVAPVVGEIFDVGEVAQTVADGVALHEDIAAAKAFVEQGPRSLESLQMSTDFQPFSSFNAFKKDVFGKYFGAAGDGYEYHHLVEQGGAGLDHLPAGVMDSTENIVKIPRLLHEEISAEYGKEYEETGISLREWLSKQPYDVRRAKGIEIMRKLGIIK